VIVYSSDTDFTPFDKGAYASSTTYIVIIETDFKDKKRAEKEINQMCKKLLANPIIEDYRFKIKGE